MQECTGVGCLLPMSRRSKELFLLVALTVLLAAVLDVQLKPLGWCCAVVQVGLKLQEIHTVIS